MLGAEIRRARRERGWTQAELADRIGITPRTVSKVEHGDLSVSLGAALEAAALLGILLFDADRPRLSAELDRTEARSALLPRPGRPQLGDEVQDDF